MAALDTAAGFVAMKQYTYVKGKLCFLVPLYSTSTGELLALIEADYMGQLRTGAASGVATKYLARKLAKVAAILGTGGQARTQLEAIHNVRMLDSVFVYGRDAERRNQFSEEMSERLAINVYPAESAGAAVRTRRNYLQRNYVLPNPCSMAKIWLRASTSTPLARIMPTNRNWTKPPWRKPTLIFVDSLAQSQQEAGDFIIPVHQAAAALERRPRIVRSRSRESPRSCQ